MPKKMLRPKTYSSARISSCNPLMKARFNNSFDKSSSGADSFSIQLQCSAIIPCYQIERNSTCAVLSCNDWNLSINAHLNSSISLWGSWPPPIVANSLPIHPWKWQELKTEKRSEEAGDELKRSEEAGAELKKNEKVGVEFKGKIKKSQEAAGIIEKERQEVGAMEEDQENSSNSICTPHLHEQENSNTPTCMTNDCSWFVAE